MVKLKKTIGFIALTLLAVVLVAGCSSSSNNNNNNTAAAITSITVTPTSVTIVETNTQKFVANCTKSDGSVVDCGTVTGVTWSATGDLVATADKTIWQAKVGGASGQVKVTWTDGVHTVVGVANVIVAKVTRVLVTSDAVLPTVAVGSVITFTATCSTNEGPNFDCTSTSTWAATAGLAQDPTIKNKFTAVDIPGVTQSQVTATWTPNGLKGNILIGIANTEVIGISISPDVGGAIEGETIIFKATCEYVGNTRADCTHAKCTDPTNPSKCTTWSFHGSFVPVPPSDTFWGIEAGQSTAPGNVYKLITGGARLETHHFVNVRYYNADSTYVEAPADIHYRWFVGMLVTPVNPLKGTLYEGDTILYQVDCRYSDDWHYACDQIRKDGGKGYITWGFANHLAWAEPAILDPVTGTTYHNADFLAVGLPGPCGGQATVTAVYLDPVITYTLTPPYDQPIVNTDWRVGRE